ncbi:hypothetical protein M440DRAFT_1120276 [Trichoderma longibrachiatum ATCC 18648]|uniref:Uncharacterized protein n=1 Tax=Trichoderma longibrachiatum ATCC 18648 TaxID=983965 RepID=A0A2T4CFB7_TRILO|nr:hypothetical protein M440DRAFT_1120276 [Trichoderma longibrachiatum ATCC 18648]
MLVPIRLDSAHTSCPTETPDHFPSVQSSHSALPSHHFPGLQSSDQACVVGCPSLSVCRRCFQSSTRNIALRLRSFALPSSLSQSTIVFPGSKLGLRCSAFGSLDSNTTSTDSLPSPNQLNPRSTSQSPCRTLCYHSSTIALGLAYAGLRWSLSRSLSRRTKYIQTHLRI